MMTSIEELGSVKSQWGERLSVMLLALAMANVCLPFIVQIFRLGELGLAVVVAEIHFHVLHHLPVRLWSALNNGLVLLRAELAASA